MYKKRYILMLLIFIIAVCAVAQVSATDSIDNLNGTDESINGDLSDGQDVLSDAHQSDEILNSDVGTYSSLNNIVQKNISINLKNDYSYNDEFDRQFAKGIPIAHQLDLNGNGHTIYANGKSNFYIVNNPYDVKISNLRFVNIYSPEYIQNAGETVYQIEEGGSIYNAGNLYLENCTFINYYTSSQGGVIYNSEDSLAKLHISNCTFINNSVHKNGFGGGAIMSYGDLTIENSKFYNCSARYGGAIFSHNKSDIYNCHFENNSATSIGGAIYKYIESVCYVFNSTFSYNKAQKGGVTYNAFLKDCSFNDNYASTLEGHNLYEGVIIGYESADFPNEYFYKTIQSTGFSFEVDRFIYEDGGLNEFFNIKITSNPSNQVVMGAYLKVVAVDEDGDNKTFYLTSGENGIASLNLSSFKKGEYNIIVSLENSDLDDVQAQYKVYIGKSDSKIKFTTGIVFEYGSSGSIFVIVEGGTVERKNIKVLNNDKAKITLKGKEIKISGLDVGNYVLQVTTTPDSDHIATTGTVGIKVKKATAVITASKLTVVYKKGNYWTIKLINSKTKKPISNMKINLKIYTGKKYKNAKIKTNSKGKATYKTSKLGKGNHKIVVSASHKGYKFNKVTTSIKVIKPKVLTYKVSKKSLRDGSSINFRVFDKKTKKPLNGVKMKLLIYTGKKVKKIILKTKTYSKKKGIAGYFTNEISVGKHKVKIMPVSIKYKGTKTTSIKLKKSAKGYPGQSSKISA